MGWKTKKEGSIRGKSRKYSLLNDQTAFVIAQPYIQWTRRVICPKMKRPNRESDHCDLNTEAKNEWKYTSNTS
jgi:hypothetical protein